jgi:cell division protein FtsQ
LSPRGATTGRIERPASRRSPARSEIDSRGPAQRRDPGARQGASPAAWLVTRLFAVLLLSGASGLLYHVATSDEFRIARVVVSGNRLLSVGELEAMAAVHGANIFWVKQEEVRQRLQALPAVQTARVTTFLPNRVEIRVGERTPVVLWESGGATFLVDHEGRVLKPATEAQPLPTIREVGPSDLQPGSTIDRGAITTMFKLQQLLPGVARATAREFEYSRETGMSVLTDFGPTVRFGNEDDLEWKVTALVAVRRELERTAQRAELIDLRFKDRPYVR